MIALRTASTFAAAATTLALLAGCASTQPVLYQTGPASKPAPAAPTKAQRDITECTRRAEVAVGRHAMDAPSTAGAAGQAGVIGFVGAAAGSMVTKSRNVWERARGAAAAGAAGMATKLLLEWNEGDRVFQKHVERCLDERGHDVLGWR
jgi:hypothetical protein